MDMGKKAQPWHMEYVGNRRIETTKLIYGLQQQQMVTHRLMGIAWHRMDWKGTGVGFHRGALIDENPGKMREGKIGAIDKRKFLHHMKILLSARLIKTKSRAFLERLRCQEDLASASPLPRSRDVL